MNLKNKLILIAILLFNITIFAQNTTLTGTVVSETDNSPIPGANIIVKNTKRGTTTDFDGKYQIQVAKGDVLQFSYLGYAIKIVTFDDQKTLNISLAEDLAALDEIVVIGYGTQKRSNITGAVSKYSNEKLDEVPVSRLDQALQGKIAGVQIQNVSSEAGADPKINIRGISSINAGASPLIVVDGQPIQDGLASINMSNVASIEVLKDAASAAIYGSRGASGVILITTKSGSSGKTTYNFKYASGFNTPYKIYEKLTSTQYVERLYKQYALIGVNPNDPSVGIGDDNKAAYAIEQNLLGGNGTDYQDEVLRLGIFTNINFSALGGNKNIKYFISGGYNKDEGMMLKSESERYVFQSKIDVNLSDKVKLSVNLTPSIRSIESPTQNFTNFTRFNSYLPIYHNELTAAWANQSPLWNVRPGDYAQPRHFSGQNYTATMPDGTLWEQTSEIGPQDGTTQNNPMSALLSQDRNTNEYRFQGGTSLTVNLLPGLDFKTSGSVYMNYSKRLEYRNKDSEGDGIVSRGIYSNSSIVDLLSENTFNYKKEFNHHSVDLLAGYTAQKTKTTRDQTTGLDYPSDNIRTLNSALAIDQSGTFGDETEVGLLSYLGRINYAFKSKYLLSASFRADGSSFFGEGNKWGTFPAVSAGWIVSEEKILKDVKWLNKWGLRTSYGVSGNNRIIDYSFTNLLNSSNYNLGPGSGAVVSGLSPNATILGNRDITWESTYQTNIGTDISLFKNRINLSIDAYQSLTDKLLLQQSIMAFTGVPLSWNNIGSLDNKGFEVELSTVNVRINDFKWSTSANISHNQNKIRELGNETFIRSLGERTEIYQSKVGDPLIQFYGYKTDGVWLSQAEINEAQAAGLQSDLPNFFAPGGLKIVDVNGDGTVNTSDRTIIGNPYPDFIWGLTNTFKYRGFDLSFSLQGSQGGELINGDTNYSDTKERIGSYIANQWLSEAYPGDGKTPFEQNGFTNWVITDYAVEDASYYALRDVNVGYTIPESVAKKINLSSLRFYLSGRNLYFHSAKGYRGINPEDRRNSGAENSLIDGYQRGGFPIPKTVTLGVDINF